MNPPRPPVAPLLASMLAVSLVMGVLCAGLVLPFAAVVDATARGVHGIATELPEELDPDDLPQRSVVETAAGERLATFYEQNRVSVSLTDVAPVMRKAILAIEDYRFYLHGAMDVRATLRALLVNHAHSGVVQGGSTITQQLVKATLVAQAENKEERRAASEDSTARKLRELRYAIGLENTRSKDWILERYLNTAYFGDGAYGVEAAAEHYFGTSAKRLRLREAALLAGLVKNPAAYDPTNDPAAARERRDVVLARMADLDAVAPQRARRASAGGLRLRLRSVPNGCVESKAPFFCDYVEKYLLHDPTLGETVAERRRLLTTGGLVIRTSLDLRAQRAADDATAASVRPTDPAIGALAMVEPGTGLVRAVSQSRPMGADVAEGETYLNHVIDQSLGDAAGFQAGSTFKAFVLAAALEQDIPTGTVIDSPPTLSLPMDRFPTCDGFYPSTDLWTLKNSTGSGRFNLYTGTQESVNTFYARLEMRTGLCEPYRLARAMGVRLESPATERVPSFTLGVADVSPLEMASAYATFAARGVSCEPTPVTAIEDLAGHLLARFEPDCERVVGRTVADTVNDILRGVQEPGGFGYSAGLALDQPSAGKTGTTNSNRAVWYVGYTPDLTAAAVIAGANEAGEPQALDGSYVGGSYVSYDVAAGSTLAGPMWAAAMQEADAWLPATDFTAPPAPPPAAIPPPDGDGDHRRNP